MENLNLRNKQQKRSPEDIKKLKTFKSHHKKKIIEAGLNPKKVMNPPNQQ